MGVNYSLAISDASIVQPVVFAATDPLHPGSSALYFVGTLGGDDIKIKGKNSGQFEVDIDANGVDVDQAFTGPLAAL